MKKVLLFLTLSLMLVSCASKKTWQTKKGENVAKFDKGEITVTPQTSQEMNNDRSLLIVKLKVQNNSNETIEINPKKDVFITSSEGESIAVMSDDELKAYSQYVGDLANAMAGGPNYRSTASTVENRFKSGNIQAGAIPPKGYKSGTLLFSVGNESKKYFLNFYNGLKSRQKIQIFTNEK